MHGSPSLYACQCPLTLKESISCDIQQNYFLKKVLQIIVINMTVADLLMCLVYMLTRPVLLHLPILLCYPYYVIICAVQLCSCFNLLW